MAATVAHSAHKEITVKNGARGTLAITLTLTFADGTDETVAQMMLDCVRGSVLEDAARDHADVIERYARDEQDLALEPTKYVCTTIEEFDGCIYKLTVNTDLPFAMPIEAHSTCLNAIEGVIGEHARDHVRDPEMNKFRDLVEQQIATPAVHLACFVYNTSPRAMLSGSVANCPLRQSVVHEIAPAEPRAYPELMQFVREHPDGPGIQISIGMDSFVRPSHSEGVG